VILRYKNIILFSRYSGLFLIEKPQL